MTKHTYHARAGQQPKPSLNRPDRARVLEPPRAAGTDVRFDKRPGPFLVGAVPRNLAIRRRVPRSARLGQQRIVQLAMKDKRDELASFDPEEGFRSIGITVARPPRRQDARSGHVMY